MKGYRVTWTAVVGADSPEEAAKEARQWLLDPNAECTLFEVKEELDLDGDYKLVNTNES